MAVDDSGVYVAGITTGNLAGPGGQRDEFAIRKYSHDGGLLWTRQLGTFLPNGDAAVDDVYAIAVGPAGVFVGRSNLYGSTPGTTFAGGLWDGFVAKYRAGGEAQWFRQFGTVGDDYGYAIALSGGLVLVAGGTGADLVSGAFVGGEDAFLRLYDSDGNVLGTQQFGNGLNDSGTGVVAVPGGFFVAGTRAATPCNSSRSAITIRLS